MHWLLGRYAQLDFAAQWCKQICYLVITHLFWTLAQRDMRRPKLTRFCLLPGLIFGFIFCTVTVVLGAITVNQYEDACEGNHCTNSMFGSFLVSLSCLCRVYNNVLRVKSILCFKLDQHTIFKIIIDNFCIF